MGVSLGHCDQVNPQSTSTVDDRAALHPVVPVCPARSEHIVTPWSQDNPIKGDEGVPSGIVGPKAGGCIVIIRGVPPG